MYGFSRTSKLLTDSVCNKHCGLYHHHALKSLGVRC
nr:MAG TPA: hypothetical protein [Caudoviricetes sp.]